MGAFTHVSPSLLLEGSAVIVAALSAMITAAKKEMDFVGVYALALVTSFGGGTIRDLLLDRRPFFWVERWEYLVIVLALCVPFVYSRKLYRWSATFVARADIIDALGLGFFTISGTALAAKTGMPAIICALLGVVTGTGGGVIRDLIIIEIPALFKHGRLHATAAMVGAALYLALIREGVGEPLSAGAGVVAVVALRLFALWRGTTLPRPHWLQTGKWRVP
ncbi:MAG: trimeric intracellular cation channel family protein [Gemmatimonadales bacterium]